MEWEYWFELTYYWRYKIWWLDLYLILMINYDYFFSLIGIFIVIDLFLVNYDMNDLD